MNESMTHDALVQRFSYILARIVTSGTYELIDPPPLATFTEGPGADEFGLTVTCSLRRSPE